MKTIILFEGQRVNAKDLLTSIVEVNGGDPITVGELAKGCRVLYAIRSSDAMLRLEDADYEHLLALVRKTKFSRVDQELMDVVNAVEHPVEDGHGVTPATPAPDVPRDQSANLN